MTWSRTWWIWSSTTLRWIKIERKDYFLHKKSKFICRLANLALKFDQTTSQKIPLDISVSFSNNVFVNGKNAVPRSIPRSMVRTPFTTLTIPRTRAPKFPCGLWSAVKVSDTDDTKDHQINIWGLLLCALTDRGYRRSNFKCFSSSRLYYWGKHERIFSALEVDYEIYDALELSMNRGNIPPKDVVTIMSVTKFRVVAQPGGVSYRLFLECAMWVAVSGRMKRRRSVLRTLFLW